jgi:hypothetical protein
MWQFAQAAGSFVRYEAPLARRTCTRRRRTRRRSRPQQDHDGGSLDHASPFVASRHDVKTRHSSGVPHRREWRDGGVLGPGGLHPFSIVNEPILRRSGTEAQDRKVKYLQLYDRSSVIVHGSVQFVNRIVEIWFRNVPSGSRSSHFVHGIHWIGDGIQWVREQTLVFRDRNPLVPGQNFSLRSPNPVDSSPESMRANLEPVDLTLESSAFELEPQCFPVQTESFKA